ncbi:DUF397 domain-containing protein [Nocardiopsis sp. NPDC049922]|uniref:DUF397 domain-containing protein n=1 Tax=Nocardiopsis sp. NPDC049922 TaxID=3155157 RepID=UPI0033E19344
MNAPSHHEVIWRKSSYSGRNTNCVEVAYAPESFRKSSYSATESHCVEVADLAWGAAIRDTKHRDLGALAFDSAEWHAFLDTARRDTP